MFADLLNCVVMRETEKTFGVPRKYFRFKPTGQQSNAIQKNIQTTLTNTKKKELKKKMLKHKKCET